MSIDQIMLARNAIVEDLKNRFKAGDKSVKPADVADLHRWHKPQDNFYSGRGITKCPVCFENTLRYSRAAYNGHIHGHCTNGCVSWME